jgi:release factor glutamine methyltransferase
MRNKKIKIPPLPFNSVTYLEAVNDAVSRLTEAGIPDARVDAELLLCHALGRNRAWLITHIHEVLDNKSCALFESAVNRRAKREPLQHIIGRQEFWGLEFRVTPDVLIPRPETELIIESSLALIKDRSMPQRIVDLCTGSGCIAISLAKELPQALVFATDASSKALVIARENAREHGVADRIRFFVGDLLGPLEELDIRGRVDIIVSNPPYVSAGEFSALQAEVRDFEPEMALIAGPVGTEFHQRIISAAPSYLNKRGALIMEMGIDQAKMLARLMEESGQYGQCSIRKDLAGIERVIVAQKK